MKLLIVNFEMDTGSSVLAWQHQVAKELAKRCEQVVVLTQRIGAMEQFPNMEVHCIPSWMLRFPFRFLGTKWLANLIVLQLCRDHTFDACFVHMNMEWVYRLAPVLRLHSVPVLLWYAHGSVTAKLKLAHYFSDLVVTSTPEGFRLPSRKVRVIGQGIDTDVFVLQQTDLAESHDIISVARISERKRLHLLIETMAVLRHEHPDIPLRLRLVGRPLTRADRRYERRLRQLVRRWSLEGCLEFVGHVDFRKVPKLYRTAFVHVNVSNTGSMDKTVLEALACGCPVLTTNEAFQGLLAEDFPCMYSPSDNPEALASRVMHIYERRNEFSGNVLRSLVVGRHDLFSYVDRIMDHLRQIALAGDGKRTGPANGGKNMKTIYGSGRKRL